MFYPKCELTRSFNNPYHDLIVCVECNLMIEVYPHEDDFEKDPAEIAYYGDDHGDPLSFETVGYNDQPLTKIIAVIRWYAKFALDYPEMELENFPF